MIEERVIKQTIEISEMYYEMATKSFENAKLLLKKDLMSYKEFEEIIDNYYQPLLTYSSKILIDRNSMIINELEKYIDEIQNLTNNLSIASKKLQNSEEIFVGITFLLASAASAATFTCAPSKTSYSASLMTIENSIFNIRLLTKKSNSKKVF